MKPLRIVLIGNPNSGKSTVFNALTGGHQHIGNWPGKTVEMMTGFFDHAGQHIEVIDLPGTYSLSYYSPEEQVVRDFLMQEKPDLVVNVVDASNLERNLYLSLQVLETGLPTLLVLNMIDVAGHEGINIDFQQLSQLLGGVEVLCTNANKNIGIEELKHSILQPASGREAALINYEFYIEEEIDLLVASIQKDEHISSLYPPRWLAIQLLEGDQTILKDVWSHPGLGQILPGSLTRLHEIYEQDPDIAIADHRYQFIQHLIDSTVKQEMQHDSLSDRFDRFATHPWLGIPFFLALMYLVFNLVQNVSAPFLDWIDYLFNGPFTRWMMMAAKLLHAPQWLASLAVDGVLAGVGGVLVFLPGLFIIYTLLAVMEQSGYMARAAFVMDRLMSKVGLHGKSFIPMILGFGCNVPAIYATRTIENRPARLLTGLLIPFMSCSARLPVYIIFGLAFFPQRANLVIFSLYLIGILMAGAVGLVLSRTLFRGEKLSMLVMELPSYRLPSLHHVMRYARMQSGEFVKNAGTVIVLFSIVLWLLLNLPWGVKEARYSYFGQFSSAIAPAFAPAGFDTWEASGSLVAGLMAKEVVVSALAQIYHLPPQAELTQPISFWQDLLFIVRGFGSATLEAATRLLDILTPGISLTPGQDEAEDIALSRALRRSFTPLSAYAFLVFVLLYVPCAATIGAQKQEFGWKYTSLSAAIMLIVPWLLATLVYQGGLLLGLG